MEVMSKTDEQIILETIQRTKEMVSSKKTKKEKQDEIVAQAEQYICESRKGKILKPEQTKTINIAMRIKNSRAKYASRENKQLLLKAGFKFMMKNKIPCMCWGSNGYNIDIACAPSRIHIGSYVYSVACKSKKDKPDNRVMLSLLGARLNGAIFRNSFFEWHTDKFNIHDNATLDEKLFFAYMSFVKKVMLNDCDMPTTVISATKESVSEIIESSFDLYTSDECIW